MRTPSQGSKIHNRSSTWVYFLFGALPIMQISNQTKSHYKRRGNFRMISVSYHNTDTSLIKKIFLIFNLIIIFQSGKVLNGICYDMIFGFEK